MDITKDPIDFARIQDSAAFVFNRGAALPERVLAPQLQFCKFLEFDTIVSRKFFRSIKEFCISIGISGFYVTVLDPDPMTYFWKYFESFASFEFSVNDSENDFIDALNIFPDGYPADSVAINSNVILVASKESSWAIIANRDCELAVCGFSENFIADLFTSRFTNEIMTFDQVVGYTQVVGLDSDFLSRFRQAYGPESS